MSPEAEETTEPTALRRALYTLLYALLYATAITLLVIFAPGESPVFIYQEF
jgi:hypothetical protein